MRLFIALNLPKKLRARIHRAAKPLRDEGLPVRWLDADHYHVTLKFLGEVRREQVPAVERTMAAVAVETRPFDTDVGSFGAFPTIRRPRVIWLGVGANPELRCLKQDLEWGLGDVGFEPETRAFHPHVTLGRADAGGGAGAFRGLDALIAELEFSGDLRVHTVDLMQSRMSREGPEYTVVSSVRLSGA